MILGYDINNKPIRKNCKAMVVGVIHNENSHLLGKIVTPVERYVGFLRTTDAVLLVDHLLSTNIWGQDACLCKNLMVISPDENIKESQTEKEKEYETSH